MFPTRMVKLIAVVLERDRENVAKALLAEGIVEFSTISRLQEEPTETLRDGAAAVPGERYASLRQRVESILRPADIGIELPEVNDLENKVGMDPKEEESALEKVQGQIQAVRDRQRALQQEIMKLEDIQRHVDIYGLAMSEAAGGFGRSFITIRTGRMPQANVERFQEDLRRYPAVAIQASSDKQYANWVIIAMKRDAAHVDKLLAGVGWTQMDLAAHGPRLQADVAADLGTQLAALRTKQEETGREVSETVARHAPELKKMWVRLRVNELLCTVQSHFKHSARTTLFSGWLPASRRQSLSRKLKKATEGRCYMEWFSPRSDSDLKAFADVPPVQFRNPRLLAPFQMLVANFGIPEYGTIDPTPYVTAIYLMMFGVMFADAGHGLVLVLLGVTGLLAFGRLGRTVRNLLALLVWCGFSSVLFGALFGSYFGKDIVPALWFDFHGLVSGHPDSTSAVGSILDMLAITVYFGIAVIAMGLLFNWINLILKRKWFELVFDKGGLLGGWIYAGGVQIGRVMVQSGYRKLPDPADMAWLVGVPALLLLLKGPLHFFWHAKQSARRFTLVTPFWFAVEWSVEMLEIFSGYLSNTLSFMRVAGLGIAHISLMIVTFELAHMAQGQGGVNVFSILIIIVGNVFVIALEGLSAGIQALRLNYYEFFTKFFHGTGRLYSPISLRSP